jgi:hypothetical protein
MDDGRDAGNAESHQLRRHVAIDTLLKEGGLPRKAPVRRGRLVAVHRDAILRFLLGLAFQSTGFHVVE